MTDYKKYQLYEECYGRLYFVESFKRLCDLKDYVDYHRRVGTLRNSMIVIRIPHLKAMKIYNEVGRTD